MGMQQLLAFVPGILLMLTRSPCTSSGSNEKTSFFTDKLFWHNMKRHSNTKPDFYRTENVASSKSKILKPITPDRHKSKERQFSEKAAHSNQYLLKGSVANKQQNVCSEVSTPVQYSPLDESAVVEVMVKTTNPPKQRSRSTVCDRKPWGQLLNKHTNVDDESVFGKFDPLRTLHFLAKELQTHMQTRLPEETNVQEIIKAMHSALKRIPPEVASTVQLQQQTVDLLPKLRKTCSKESFDERPSNSKINDEPPTSLQSKEFGEIQKLIEGSTMKLEARCKDLENLLQNESTNSKLLENRIHELEQANSSLTLNLSERDRELMQLRTTIEVLESKLQEQNRPSDMQSVIADLKKSKLHLEQETSKFQHQLRLCAIEKEKYLAILAVRDRQIYEIRNEMTQLQQSVNEQLVELHNYAVSSVPEDPIMTGNKGCKEVDTISSIWVEEGDKLHPTHDIFQGVS